MLDKSLKNSQEALEQALTQDENDLVITEIGYVTHLGKGIAQVKGLRGVKSEELIEFSDGSIGMAFNLLEEEVGVILLNKSNDLLAGSEARRTKRVADVPVGPGLLGRVLNATGLALDNGGLIPNAKCLPIERTAPDILSRAPVVEPLRTGLKVIDALIPIGKGQRQLIVGDRQTGKTSIALDAIVNQRGKDVICVYCAIGQRGTAISKLIHELKVRGALEYSVVVASTGEDAPGLQYITPYAATSIAESFMAEGRDVLIVYDDLTRHALIYRELSLLLRRPPGREAFPGDIFYIHSRLLERSTHLSDKLGGGSLTALPIVETEAQNISAYIPTNLISITDGQIYLNPSLFQKGLMPAVDVGKSVSRVGGKTQLKAYRQISGKLRLSYAQFEELEVFSRFGTRLDDSTKKILARGYRVREILKQDLFTPFSISEQVVIFMMLNEGLFDDREIMESSLIQELIRNVFLDKFEHIIERIETGDVLTDQEKNDIFTTIKKSLHSGLK